MIKCKGNNLSEAKQMLDFLRSQGVSEELIFKIKDFRAKYPVDENSSKRIPVPRYRYYGRDIWEKALTALLAGENILLVGPKATGKNVLAENLAAVFERPEWDISFYLNTDAASLIGTDTFSNGEVSFRHGPIYRCAEHGGFGILDEINMAKNESLAVLHAVLDFRRIIDVPGYDRISLAPCTRFIATMNYGYAGTRELNEALASRFMVINMPIISRDNLESLLRAQFPKLKVEYARQFAQLFHEIREKCDSSEISTKPLDLRGLVAALNLVDSGLTVAQALEMGIVNKSFDDFERQLVSDIIAARLPASIGRETIFES